MRATHVVAAFFAATAFVLAASEPAKDPDLFWHLASGEWMLDHGRLLDRDVFSSTRDGTPYAIGQWLGQLALALAFRAGGWAAIDLLRAALVGIGTLFLARAVLRVQPHPGWAALPIVAAVLVSRLAWGDRPQLFTIALFPVFLDVLLRARLGGGTRALFALPPLALLWANLHGAFPLGLALVLAFTVEALLARHALRRPLALVLVLSAVASQVNPAAAGALAWAASYASSPGRHVVEERPTDVLSPAGALFAALLLASLAAALALGRTGIAQRAGPPLLWAGVLVPFAILGLAIQRQMPYACDVLAPFAAAAVPAALGRAQAQAPVAPRALAGALIALLAAGATLAAIAAAPREPDLGAYPVAAREPLARTRGTLLNEYDWGGYLIYFVPERPVFIDGRGAALYVPDVLADWTQAVEVRAGYRDVLARHDVGAVLLRPHRPLVAALREQGWPVVGEQADHWILLARPQ